MKMKRALIVALLCLNVGLLLSLALNSTPRAYGQTFRGTDYLMVTATLDENWDGVFVIDLASRRLAGWKVDQQRRRLVTLTGRDLNNDFRREAK
jgi:hypothetical protein